MRPEVLQFVKSRDICQETKPANRREITGRIHVSGIFNTWPLDYSGLLPATKKGNRYINIGVEHTSRWPVALAIPPSMFRV